MGPTRTLTIVASVLAVAVLSGPAAVLAGEGDLRARIREALQDSGDAKADLMAGLGKLGPEKASHSFAVLLQARHRCFVELEAGRLVKRPDHRSMTRDILVDTVELALDARARWPWAKDLPGTDFATWVLPHRHSTERLTNWRRLFCDDEELSEIAEGFARRYEEAPDREGKSRVFRELLHHLNSRWLASKVRYAPRGMPALAPGELMANGSGRCTDLTCAIVCICRSLGIAATGVRAIWWPKGDGNHCWAGVKDPVTGEWYDFDAGLCGEMSDQYFRAFRNRRSFAKVYRITPGEELGRIAQIATPRHGEAIDPYIDLYLVSRPMVDVTAVYGPSVTVTAKTRVPPESPIYACVFNHGTWLPVAVARTDERGAVLFQDLGADSVLYLIAPAAADGSANTRLGIRLFVAGPTGAADAADPMESDDPVETTLSSAALKGVPEAELLECTRGRFRSAGRVQVSGSSVELMLAPGVVYVLRTGPHGGPYRHTRPFVMDDDGKISWH